MAEARKDCVAGRVARRLNSPARSRDFNGRIPEFDLERLESSEPGSHSKTMPANLARIEAPLLHTPLA